MKQRVRFTKLGKIRFLSHRDLARIWERSLRRSGIQVAYSEGFSPRPRLSFGLALSTGHESLGEYLDIDLAEDLDPADLPGIVTPSLPEGMTAQVAVVIPPGIDSLQQAVVSSSWQVGLPDVPPEAIEAAIARVLAAPELPIEVERKGNPVTFDARPAILAVAPADGGLTAELATQPRSLRPAELLQALDPQWGEGRVLRTHQWTLVDGARCEPIPFGDSGTRGATSTPHAGARA
jgi:radical SAM-linked protein